MSPHKAKQSESKVVTAVHPSNPIRLFLVNYGLDMYRSRIEFLTKRAQGLGATVLPIFQCPQPPKRRRAIWGPPVADKPKPILPTHLIVSNDERTTAEQVAEHLLFPSKEKMEKYFVDNGIQCATPEWLVHAKGPLNPILHISQRNLKIANEIRKKKRKPEKTNMELCLGECSRRESQRFSQSQRLSQSQPIAPPPNLNYPSDDEEDRKQRAGPYPNNIKIAQQLQILGKLHQKCPLTSEDLWKSYTLDKAAGRIKNLPFEVTLGQDSQRQLAQVWGIGKSTQLKINQVLETGTIDRIQEFPKDPRRMAAKNLMGIWGIGRSIVPDWIELGIRTIGDVRERMDELELNRNQRIGIECYEDFLERFTRQEAQTIGKIIEDAIRRQFPMPKDQTKLEITIMGSYRRGKQNCGDVDVLITHQEYVDIVPSEVLGEVVEDLMDRGHMAFHLTFIGGMKVRTGKEYHRGGYNEVDGAKNKIGKETANSYMGVFNSPTVKGKRRRVDIKFYPHRERAFAWLYFTGNGFFNRSMRLYATKMKGLQMNDKGLFTRDERDMKRVVECSTEKEVFDYLGLEYKEPHERDSFDAVVTDEGGDEQQEKRAFLKEEVSRKWEDPSHKWID